MSIVGRSEWELSFGDLVQTPEGRGVIVRIPFTDPLTGVTSGYDDHLEDGTVEVALDGQPPMFSGRRGHEVQRGKVFPAAQVAKRTPVDNAAGLAAFLNAHAGGVRKKPGLVRARLLPKALPTPKVGTITVGSVVRHRRDTLGAQYIVIDTSIPARKPKGVAKAVHVQNRQSGDVATFPVSDLIQVLQTRADGSGTPAFYLD